MSLYSQRNPESYNDFIRYQFEVDEYVLAV